MSIINVIILGIVEGITEFLPISSTGHLILSARILQVPSTDFVKSFEIIIQLGAILAVVVLYFKKFLNWTILKRLAIGFLPTALLGLIAYPYVKKYLLGSEAVVLWSLLLGGIILILFEKFYKEKITISDNLENIPYNYCLLLGLFQSIAIIPGVSRAAATIVGGLLLGFRRRAIVEFSFLLAVPTMLGAAVFDFGKSAGSFASGEFLALAVGFTASFIMAVVAIKFLLKFIQTHTFVPFGIYRIGLAGLLMVILLI